MRGLTKLEVFVLQMAGSSKRHGNEHGGPEVTDAILRLIQRRLIRLEEVQNFGNGMSLAEGVLTPLGALVLSACLSEPSLIVP